MASRKKFVANLLAINYPNYNPVLAMAELAMDEEVDIKDRIQCHKEVAAYCFPKMKAEEAKDDGVDKISKAEVIARLQALEGNQVTPLVEAGAEIFEAEEELPFSDADFAGE
jgi:hypothetical protein